MALYGLQRMSSDWPEVRQLVAALVPKLRACSSLSSQSQAFAMAMHGMQQMSSEHSAVRQLVAALARLPQGQPQPQGHRQEQRQGHRQGQGQGGLFSSVKALSMVLFGLQRLSSSEPEVRQLLCVVAALLEASQERFDTHAVRQALLGLSSMHCDCPEASHSSLI